MFQMLGAFDAKHGYSLPKDIADLLIKMPKKPIISKDEIDVGTNVAFLQGSHDTEFCLDGNVLYFVERATEIGGLVAFTYLTPLTEITEEYFNNLDAGIDLTPLRERRQKRRAQYVSIMAECEHLARGANRRVQKTLRSQALPEYNELISTAKRFVRLGKPDYCTSQLQILSYIIDKNDLTHPATEIINGWKTACNNKAAAQLVCETQTNLHKPEITERKKDSDGNKGKKIDFKSLLAAMLKQDAPKKPVTRLQPSEGAAKILNAEAEIELDFEPEQKFDAQVQGDQLPDDEIKLQKLVEALLEKYKTSANVKPQIKARTARQDMLKDHSTQLAPVSSNRDREQ